MRNSSPAGPPRGGAGNATGAWSPPPGAQSRSSRQVVVYQSATRRRPGRARRRLIVLAVLLAAVLLVRQLNGSGGAGLADFMRATIGPSATARIEATYLDLLDKLHGLQYQLGGDTAQAPWAVTPATGTPTSLASETPVGVLVPTAMAPHQTRTPVARVRAKPTSMAPAPLAVLIRPALAGEGLWTASGLPAAGANGLAPVLKTFLRPDASRPYALVTVMQFDFRAARLHIVAGISEPGGSIGHPGTGLIPVEVVQQNKLLAVFNGGFKFADGAYGLMSGGTVYVQPVWGAATIAVTKDGSVIMGSWGLDHRLSGTNRALLAWRQNAGLLIDHGRVSANTEIGSAWGLTILNSTYTWRSGIGVTRQGTLLYAAGNSLSATTLARSLAGAGAVTAMQLDINPFWVRAYTYGRDDQNRLVATPLDAAMPGTGMEYLYGHVRDFFYLTRA